MGERFFAYSAFSTIIAFNREAARSAVRFMVEPGTLLTDSGNVVLVAELDGKVIGGIAGMLTGTWFNPYARVATELAWWMDEGHRGGTAAIRLYRAFEAWAQRAGAEAIVMSDLVIDGETPAARLFEKLGYATVERAHIKRSK